MASNPKEFIGQYSLQQQQSGGLSLLLYFNDVPTVNVHDKWVEETAALPQIVQQQLDAVDAILTACHQKGLCDKQSTIVLKGINFYNADLQSYADVYIHQSRQRGFENIRLSCAKPPKFTGVEYQQGSAVIHIEGSHDEDYQKDLCALLETYGVHKMQVSSSIPIANRI